MKSNRVNEVAFLVSVISLVFIMGCMGPREGEEPENQAIFPGGQLAPEEFFTGNVWVTGLVDNDSVFTTAGGEVFFEAGARSNWHLHPSGQILIVTSGVGYHQLVGEAIEVIHKGDVVKCPPGILHWHGASAKSSMSHIYIVPNTEKGIVEWGEPVTDQEYHGEVRK